MCGPPMSKDIPSSTQPKYKLSLREEVSIFPTAVIGPQACNKKIPLMPQGHMILNLLLVMLLEVVGV